MFLQIPTVVIMLLTVIVTLLLTLLLVFDKLETSKLKTQYAAIIALLVVGLVSVVTLIGYKEYQLAQVEAQIESEDFWEMLEAEAEDQGVAKIDTTYRAIY